MKWPWIARITLLVVLLVVGPATPAFADGGIDTNYSSRVTEITPATNALHAKVSGGDSFLEIRVAIGHTVVVQGYEHEPYLQVLADGTVQVNENSPATYLNNDRYATTVPPPSADAKAPPSWKTVGANGHYAWHSHLIHFMSPGLPEVLKQQNVDHGLVQNWTVAITLDGAPAQIRGTLNLLTAPSPFLPIAVALGTFLIGWLMLRRWPNTPVGIATGALALGLAVVENRSAPIGSPGVRWPMYVAGASVLLAVGAVLKKRNRAFATVVQIAASALLFGWSVGHRSEVTNAVLTTSTSPTITRVAVATIFGFACATLATFAPNLVPVIDDESLDDDTSTHING